MQVAALGLLAAVCLGVVETTDGCIAGAVGAPCIASKVHGVVTGCPATLTLVCMPGLTAFGW